MQQHKLSWLSLALLSAVWFGCATGGPAGQGVRGDTAGPGRRARRLQLEPIKLTLARDGRVDIVDAMGLFEDGGRQLNAKRYDAALARYDRLLAEFPASRLVSPSLYNAGLAHEALGRFDRAAARYEELARRFGRTRNAIDAGFRLGACYAELRQWSRSAQVFGRLLARRDLGSGDRIEAFARKGLAHFRSDDVASTRRTLRAGIRFHASVDPFERLDSDFFLGMIHYYRAALPHLDFRKTELDGSGGALARRLDAKARLLLVSQTRYIETIKVRNPYWATAAGFQIGSLYKEFYDVMMGSLPDFSAAARRNAKRAKISPGAAKRQLRLAYLEQLHQRILPLLKKAIRVFERNVVVARRLGVKGAWVDKSRKQMNILSNLLTSSPQEAIQLLPRDPVVPEDQPGEAEIQPGDLPPAEAGSSGGPEQPGNRRLML